jgi:hypothetical protein
MDVDAGTVVLGLVLDTLSGRSPLRCTAWKSSLPIKTLNCSWASLSLRTPFCRGAGPPLPGDLWR